VWDLQCKTPYHAPQYRLASNYRDPKFLLGRIVDKLLCCMVLIILYNGLGKNTSPDNLINISSLLYMYTVLPGFAAISYMPRLVLERPLYVRCSHQFLTNRCEVICMDVRVNSTTDCSAPVGNVVRK
jgi:hypothetical protein